MAPRSTLGARIGEQIRRLRSQRGIPQQVLAELAGFSPSTFKRIEAGRTPTVDELDAIAAVLRVTRSDLLPEGDQAATRPLTVLEVPPVRRREFLEALGMGATALGSSAVLTGANDRVDALVRLAHVLGGSRPDTVTIDYLDERFADYWQDYYVTKLPASELMPYAFEDLNRVSALLEGSLSPSSRTRLNAIAARAATVVGALLWDVRAYAKSRDCLEMGIRAARDANDRTMEAVGWAWTSLSWMYDSPTAESGRRAIDSARAGRELCPPRSPTASWLAAIEAEAYANADDRPGLRDALRHAGRAADPTPSSADWFWTRFDQAGLAGYRGVCELRLGRATEARSALTDALELLDVSERQRRLTLIIDLARADARDDAVEEACVRAREAMSLAAELRSPVKAQRLLALRRDLASRRDVHCVRLLEDELMTDPMFSDNQVQ